MKNLIKFRTFTFKKKSMRNLISLALIFSASLSFAQSGLRPGSNQPIEFWSQMWNTNSVYFGTPTTSNLGSQLDTVVNAATLNLKTASFLAPGFRCSPLNGTGNLNVVVSVLKCTGTPTVTVTLLGSQDSVNWASASDSTFILQPASLTVPLVKSFRVSKQFRYYEAAILGSASSTISVKAGYYFLKSNFIGL